MRSKHIPLLMSILICITMISVGFSSWVTLNPPTDGSQSGTLDSYPVYISSDYVTHTEVVPFTFSALSFLDPTSMTPVSTGTIVATYNVNIANCKRDIGDTAWSALGGKLTLITSLWMDNTNGVFTYPDVTGQREVTATATVNGSDPISGTRDASTTNYGFTFDLTGVPDSGACVVVVTYTFNVPETATGGAASANFRQMLGKYIKVKTDDKTVFLTSARIGEVE